MFWSKVVSRRLSIIKVLELPDCRKRIPAVGGPALPPIIPKCASVSKQATNEQAPNVASQSWTL